MFVLENIDEESFEQTRSYDRFLNIGLTLPNDTNLKMSLCRAVSNYSTYLKFIDNSTNPSLWSKYLGATGKQRKMAVSDSMTESHRSTGEHAPNERFHSWKDGHCPWQKRGRVPSTPLTWREVIHEKTIFGM